MQKVKLQTNISIQTLHTRAKRGSTGLQVGSLSASAIFICQAKSVTSFSDSLVSVPDAYDISSVASKTKDERRKKFPLFLHKKCRWISRFLWILLLVPLHQDGVQIHILFSVCFPLVHTFPWRLTPPPQKTPISEAAPTALSFHMALPFLLLDWNLLTVMLHVSAVAILLRCLWKRCEVVGPIGADSGSGLTKPLVFSPPPSHWCHPPPTK